MGGGLLPSWEETTTRSPELDRVSVMAGGNLWHLPLPPSLSSHRKAAGVLPVRAKVVGGVCGDRRRAMQPTAPLVPIKTPSRASLYHLNNCCLNQHYMEPTHWCMEWSNNDRFV